MLVHPFRRPSEDQPPPCTEVGGGDEEGGILRYERTSQVKVVSWTYPHSRP